MSMTFADYEALSAFFDGEDVDPERLAESLAYPEARAFLVELAQLRAAAQADTSHLDEGFREELRARLQAPEPFRRFKGSSVAWPAAAGLALMTAMAGYGARWWTETEMTVPVTTIPVVMAPPEVIRPRGSEAVLPGINGKEPPAAPPARTTALVVPQPSPPGAAMRVAFTDWHEEGERD